MASSVSPLQFVSESPVEEDLGVVHVQLQGGVEVVECFLQVAVVAVHDAAVEVQARVAAVQLQGGFEVRHGADRLALFLVDAAAIDVSLEVQRVQPQGIGVIGDGPVALALLPVSVAAANMGQGEHRVQPQHLAVVGDGGVEVAEGGMGTGPVLVAERIVGVQLQRLGKIADGRLVVAEVGVGVAAVIQRRQVVGVELQGQVVVGDGLVEPAQHPVGLAAVDQDQGIGWVEPVCGRVIRQGLVGGAEQAVGVAALGMGVLHGGVVLDGRGELGDGPLVVAILDKAQPALKAERSCHRVDHRRGSCHGCFAAAAAQGRIQGRLVVLEKSDQEIQDAVPLVAVQGEAGCRLAESLAGEPGEQGDAEGISLPGPHFQERPQAIPAGALEAAGEAFEHQPVSCPIDFRRWPGHVAVERFRLEHASLARGPQLLPAQLPPLRVGPAEFLRSDLGEQGSHRLAQAAGKTWVSTLGLFAQALAGQHDFQRVPGPLTGRLQGLDQRQRAMAGAAGFSWRRGAKTSQR